jgi:hypothetical protein
VERGDTDTLTDLMAGFEAHRKRFFQALDELYT